MAIISKLIERALYRGGILAAGIFSMYLTRSGYLPRFAYHISYSMTAFGILGVIAGLRGIPEEGDKNEDQNNEEENRNEDHNNEENRNEDHNNEENRNEDHNNEEQNRNEGDEDEEEEDPGRAERMAEFERLRPSLIATLQEQGRLLMEYHLDRQRELQIEFVKRESNRLERMISAYLVRLSRTGSRFQRRRPYRTPRHLDDSCLKYFCPTAQNQLPRERLPKYKSL